ncbi:MAG: N-formylglutamate amidohydrolase [Pseudomonadota bacterium]
MTDNDPVDRWPADDPALIVAPTDFLIEREAPRSTAVVVSVPHYGIGSPRPYRTEEFATRLGHHLAFGFADDYAAELYGDLHEAGAHVIATRLSRLFVDVNRPRTDVDFKDGRAYSRTGVVRTHSRRDTPIFATPPTAAEVEQRLSDYYDPFYGAVQAALDARASRHGGALLLDMHTANARRMGEHEIVLGTSRGRTASDETVALLTSVFERHAFKVDLNVPGYGGANVVRSFGAHVQASFEAVQIEVNAGLLQPLENSEFIALQIGGHRPPPKADILARLRRCLREVVTTSIEYCT